MGHDAQDDPFYKRVARGRGEGGCCKLWSWSLSTVAKQFDKKRSPPSRDPIQSIHLSTGSRGKGQKELFDKLLQTWLFQPECSLPKNCT